MILTNDKIYSQHARATQAALLGLGVQVAMSVALFMFYLSTRSFALEALFVLAVVGLPIWAVLLLVSAQRRQARVESIELDQIRRGDTASQSLFLNVDDEVTPSARRVRWLERWGFMIVSFLVAGSLATIGLLMARGIGFAASDMVVNLATIQQVAWFMAGTAFLGFLTSRYLLGVSQAPGGELIRAGAVYLGGLVVLLLLIIVGVALVIFNMPTFISVLNKAMPWVVVLIGAELFFNQILDFYRPRKSGEVIRPAFESRLFALFSAPGSFFKGINEAVNYQFGFEITNSWFWQLLTRHAVNLVSVGAFFLWGVSALVVVEPQQQVLVSRFGKLVGPPLDPGLHLKLPWPIDTTERFDVTSSRQFVVGSHQTIQPDQPILWTNRHAGGNPETGQGGNNGEMLMMIAPPKSMLEDEARERRGTGVLALPPTVPPDISPTGETRTPAITLAGAEVFVQWRIKDVLQYAKTAREASRKLNQLADAISTRALYRVDIDELIGLKRTELAIDIGRELQAQADTSKLGVEILWVGLAGIHPAQQVADAFHETVGSTQERQTRIEQAQQQAVRFKVESAGGQDLADRLIVEIGKLEGMPNGPDRDTQADRVEQMVLSANGQAAQTIARARAERWQKANDERGRAAMFDAQLKAYAASPNYFIARNYFNALIDGMADSRNKTFMIGDWTNVTYRPDLGDQGGLNNTIQLAPQ